MKKISIEVAIQINEEFSAICKKFPDKFGFVVTIPIPSVEGSIEEIKFSTEKLGALGVKVASNFDGIYSATKLKFWKILPTKLMFRRFANGKRKWIKKYFARRKKILWRFFLGGNYGE